MHMYFVWDKANNELSSQWVVARDARQAINVAHAHDPEMVSCGTLLSATHVKHEPFQRVIFSAIDGADILRNRSTWSIVKTRRQKTYRKRFTK